MDHSAGDGMENDSKTVMLAVQEYHARANPPLSWPQSVLRQLPVVMVALLLAPAGAAVEAAFVNDDFFVTLKKVRRRFCGNAALMELFLLYEMLCVEIARGNITAPRASEEFSRARGKLLREWCHSAAGC